MAILAHPLYFVAVDIKELRADFLYTLCVWLEACFLPVFLLLIAAVGFGDEELELEEDEDEEEEDEESCELAKPRNNQQTFFHLCNTAIVTVSLWGLALGFD